LFALVAQRGATNATVVITDGEGGPPGPFQQPQIKPYDAQPAPGYGPRPSPQPYGDPAFPPQPYDPYSRRW
jgi:hypothetical protein